MKDHKEIIANILNNSEQCLTDTNDYINKQVNLNRFQWIITCILCTCLGLTAGVINYPKSDNNAKQQYIIACDSIKCDYEYKITHNTDSVSQHYMSIIYKMQNNKPKPKKHK